MATQRPLGERVGRSPARRPVPTTLEGASIRLDPLILAHVPSLFPSTRPPIAGPDLWDYLPYGPFESLAALEAWTADVEEDDPLFFAICERATRHAHGLASPMRIDEQNGVIEIGTSGSRRLSSAPATRPKRSSC